MKFLVTALLVALFLAPPASAQSPSTIGGPPPPPPPKPMAVKWQTFTSEAGNFSVLLPAAPQQSVQPADSPLGKIQMHNFTAGTGERQCAVMYADYPVLFDTPGSIEASFNSSRDSVVNRTGGKVIEEKEIFFGGYPGREWKIKIAVGVMWSRHYLINQRLYMLVMFLPADSFTQPATAKEVAQFFESFKLLKVPEIPANIGAASNVGKAAKEFKAPADFRTRPLAWREMSFAAYGFKVSLPSEPVEETAALNPTDPRLNIKIWIARGEDYVCQVIVQPLLDAPKDKVMRDSLLNSMAKSVADGGVKVVQETPSEFQGHPGRAYQLRAAFGEGTGKVYLVGRHIYLLSAFTVGPKAKPEEIARFFASFQLIDAPAPPTAPAAVPTTVWKEFASQEDRFSVLLPGEPEREAKAQDTEIGKLQITQFVARNGEAVFLVQRCEFPASAEDLSQATEELFDGIMEPIFKGATGPAPSQHTIDLNGFPGREAKGKSAEGQYISARSYLVGTQLYNLIVFTAADKADAPEVKKFFESFKLTKP